MSRSPRMALLALSLSGMVAATACRSAPTRPTLTLWHPWGGAELAALKQVLGRYQKQHAHVEVIALQVPSDKLQDKYLRSTAANGGPDLLFGPTDWIGKFAQSEVLASLDDVVEPAMLERYLPLTVSALRYQGHLYALPESIETVALYYNKKLLDGAPPSTLQRLFVEANSRDYWRGDFFLAYNTQFFYSAGYLFGMGGSLLRSDGTLAVDTPGAAHWLKLLHDLKTHPKIAAKSDYARADGLFRDGKAAMTINGPWALRDYQKALGQDLGVATLPMVEEQVPAVPFVGIKCMMFNPNIDRDQLQRAVDFAGFMVSPEVARLMVREAGHIPAVRDVKVPAGDPLEPFATQARWGTPLMPNPEMREVWAPMDQAIEKVMTDVSSPQDAIREAQAVISAKIEAVRKQ